MHSLLAQQHTQALTGKPRRTHMAVSWAGLVVSWPRPSVISQPKPPCHIAHARAPASCAACRASRLLPAPRAQPVRLACAPLAPCRAPSALPSAVSWLGCTLYRNTMLSLMPLPQSQYTLLYCDTICLRPALQPQSRYKICIVTHCLSQPSSHSFTIQLCVLQYSTQQPSLST